MIWNTIGVVVANVEADTAEDAQRKLDHLLEVQGFHVYDDRPTADEPYLVTEEGAEADF